MTIPDIPEILVSTPKGQMVLVGYYVSHSMGSRLHPDQFKPVTMVICEGVEYGPDGQTRGLVLETFNAAEIEPMPDQYPNWKRKRLEDMEGYDSSSET